MEAFLTQNQSIVFFTAVTVALGSVLGLLTYFIQKHFSTKAEEKKKKNNKK